MIPEKRKMIVLLLLLFCYLLYSLILYSELPVKLYSKNKEGEIGKLVWQKYNCNSCHQLYGLGGYLGPDLTNVYSSRSKEYIKSFLMNGTATMPKFNINEYEINSLIQYFRSIDNSGKSDPRIFRIKTDGTIE